MSENPLGNDSKLKLKLKNTDTNRFKVATGQMQKPPAAEEAPAAQQPGADPDSSVNKASVTQPVSDPLSLRDTATGKLKRLTDTQDAANALAPQPINSPGTSQATKTETVRLKVVRSAARPTVNLTQSGPQVAPPPRPTISLAPNAAPQRPAAQTDNASPAPTASAKLETQASAKTSHPAAPAPATSGAGEEDTIDGKPAGPATATPKLSSSTIKLNIRKPGAQPEAAAAAVAPEQTVQVAPPSPERAPQVSPPADAADAQAPAAGAVPNASSTLKIRPASGDAPAPAAADSSASATVKIKAPPPAAGTEKKKITLKKDLPPVATSEPAAPVPLPVVAAAADSAAPMPEATEPAAAESAQATTSQPTAEPKKTGLKIRKSGETQNGATATQSAVPSPAANDAAAEKGDNAPVAMGSTSASGGTTSIFELMATSVAAIAVVVSIVRFVLDMVQQIQ